MLAKRLVDGERVERRAHLHTGHEVMNSGDEDMSSEHQDDTGYELGTSWQRAALIW